MLGVPAEQLQGHTNAEVFDPDTAEAITEVQQQALTTAERVEQTVTLSTTDAPAHYRLTAKPATDDDGTVIGVMFAAVDLSSEFRYLEQTTDAAFTVDADWTITFWNDRMARRTGWSADDVVGKIIGISLAMIFHRNLHSDIEP